MMSSDAVTCMFRFRDLLYLTLLLAKGIDLELWYMAWLIIYQVYKMIDWFAGVMFFQWFSVASDMSDIWRHRALRIGQSVQSYTNEGFNREETFEFLHLKAGLVGAPEKRFRDLTYFHSRYTSAVLHYVNNELFDINSDVVKGENVSPMLFALCLKYIKRKGNSCRRMEVQSQLVLDKLHVKWKN